MKEIIKMVNDDENIKFVGLEIELLLEDCYEILDAISVYKELTNSSTASNRMLFSRYYHVVENSLVYRIVLGLSKLFDSHPDVRSIKKLVNVLKQEKTIDEKANVLLDELKCLILTVNNNYNIRELRNRYFAHLDKKYKFSSLRISHALDYVEDLEIIINNIIKKFIDLYNIYFGSFQILTDNRDRCFEIPKLEQIKDISAKASEFLEQHAILKKWFYFDKKGLHFKK